MFYSNTYEVLGIPCPNRQDEKNISNVITTLSDEELAEEDEEQWKNIALSFEFDNDKKELIRPRDNQDGKILLSLENTKSTKETSLKKTSKIRKIKDTCAKEIVSSPCYEAKFNEFWEKSKLKFEEKLAKSREATLQYVLALDNRSSVYQVVKKSWECLFTKTTEEKQYKLFKTLTNHENMNELVSNCDVPMTDDLTNKDKYAGLHFFLTKIYEMGQIHMHSNLENNKTRVVKEDQRTIYYVAGFIVHKLVSSKISIDSRAIGEILRETDLSKVPEKLREWVDAQNRKSLKYPTMEAIEMIEMIMQHIGKYFNQYYITNRKLKVIEDINSDFVLNTKFNIIAAKAKINSESAKHIFNKIVTTAINVSGNGNNKKSLNELKAAKRSKQLTTKTNSKLKVKTKMEQILKEEIRFKYKLVL